MKYLQLNTAAPQTLRRRGEPALFGGLMTAAVIENWPPFFMPFLGQPHKRQKRRNLWHFLIRQ